jgi:hypothetical protein
MSPAVRGAHPDQGNKYDRAEGQVRLLFCGARAKKLRHRDADTWQFLEAWLAGFALIHISPMGQKKISHGYTGHLILHRLLAVLKGHRADTDGRLIR